MENSDFNHQESNTPIRLNEEAIRSLTETRKWTTFFGILGIIAIALMLLAAAIMTFVLPILNEGNDLGFPPVFIGLLYLVLGGLYVLPVLYLMRFGNLARKALLMSDEQLMGNALRNLTLHFRVVGIFAIVMISLYILMIIAMLVFGMGMFAGNMIGA
ncbi:MAG: hypothetical protein FD166_1290 [Bacteroidetes bacterium]|nr:MAG: hypothetical protein FD166_1290 [Bacteroidota bacterium]